jgi:hypothetical protein
LVADRTLLKPDPIMPGAFISPLKAKSEETPLSLFSDTSTAVKLDEVVGFCNPVLFRPLASHLMR